jgi:UDP-glucose 4-epimerase
LLQEKNNSQGCSEMATYFITGGAGFIGSSLADRLASNQNDKVIIYDNLSTGLEDFLINLRTKSNVNIVKGDLLDTELLKESMKGVDFVFHLAANADVRFGTEHPRKDLEQNTIATFNVLEAMRVNNVKKIGFSSTGSVYGEAAVIPTPEDAPFPIQTSLYGASKSAGEGLIAAYCEGFGFQSWIFRFVSILGERYTHGHVFDFYKKLLDNPNELSVLGNGKQRKSYLYIQDCIDAILIAINRAQEKVNILNLGTNEYCEVNNSIGWITESLGLKPELKYTGGERGWIGDNPFIYLDCSKMRSLGWEPKVSIKDAIIKTLQYLQNNKWVLEER